MTRKVGFYCGLYQPQHVRSQAVPRKQTTASLCTGPVPEGERGWDDEGHVHCPGAWPIPGPGDLSWTAEKLIVISWNRKTQTKALCSSHSGPRDIL